MTKRVAYIKSIATHLPEGRITNEDLSREFPDWTPEKIVEKTGIVVRAVAGPDECASDLGCAAAEKLFGSGTCAREDVDFLLFCTQSPDYYLPPTACAMQDRLGLRKDIGALDFNLGCSGFVEGLSLAKGLIESGQVDNVLLITAETYSKYIHPRDKSVKTIFSDGAAATLVSHQQADRDRIGPFVFGTDGRGAKNLIVPAGCHRLPSSPDTAVESTDSSGSTRSPDNLYMNGAELFTFTLLAVHKAVEALLAKAEVGKGDIDYFVFHQANRYMLENLRRKSGIAPEKFCINVEHFGNTVSSTIPMAIEVAAREGHIAAGSRVMIVGFGVGYSWAAALIEL